MKEHISANHGNKEPREKLSRNQPKLIFIKPTNNSEDGASDSKNPRSK